MKFFKTILLFVVLVFAGFVGWMNVTPGYFHLKIGSGCDNRVVYERKGPGLLINCLEEDNKLGLTETILVALSNLDLKK